MKAISNQKKIAILTLLIMIINVFMPIIANAEDTASISLKIDGTQKEYYDVGEEFTVVVELTNPQSNANVLTGLIKFDEEKLEISNSLSWNDALQSYKIAGTQQNLVDVDVDSMYIIYNENEGITFLFDGSSAGVNAGSFKIKFKVKDNSSGLADVNFENAMYEYIGATDEIEYPISVGEKITVNTGKPPVALESIAITPEGPITLGVGENKILDVVYNPEDTTEDKTVVWTSNNTAVATIEQSGKVTAVAPGTATITAAVGNKTDSVTINVTSKLTKIDVSPSVVNLETNTENKNKSTLTVTYTPNNTTDSKEVTWESSDTSVATVNPGAAGTAEITAVGNGTATITVHSEVEGVADATTAVNVITAVKSVSLDKTSGTLNKGDTVDLVATVTPSDASEVTKTWTSSDDSVATVDANGKVTAKGKGTAIITVTAKDANNNSVTATYTVEVKVPLTSINLGDNFQLYKGQTKTLEVVYTPNKNETTDETRVRWESDNTAVATVDENGIVTAVKPGTATITATTIDAAHTDSVTVTVPQVHVATIVLNKNETIIEKGKSDTLSVIEIISEDIAHEITDDTTVTWSSDNEAVATVDENGVVKAIAPGENGAVGTATITATVAGKTATCAVKVISKLNDITLSETDIELEKNNTKTITVTYNPEDTTDNRTVTWSSKNEQVATVDQDGKITAVAGGNAVIEAKVGSITKTVNVKVVVPLTGVSLKQSTEILKGGTETLVVKYNPEDTTNTTTLKWTSDNEAVAKVDQNGKVTGIKAGTANITVTVETDKGEKFEATTVVTVKEIKLTGISITNKKDILYKNEVLTLSIIFNPENTTDDRTIIWSSSDEDVAKVDQNGKVIALKAGTVTITAKVKKEDVTSTTRNAAMLGGSLVNGYYVDTVEIEVVEVHTESITLSTDAENNTINVGEELHITPSFYPLETTDSRKLKFISSDESIATIDEYGNVTAIAPGEVTITAIDENGVKSQITITITEADVEESDENVASPKTGDINIALYVSIMIISLIGIVIEIKRK